MTNWPHELRLAALDVIGPEDEIDDEVNGDPDSLTGEWENERDSDQDHSAQRTTLRDRWRLAIRR
jgi:hypothetical protein